MSNTESPTQLSPTGKVSNVTKMSKKPLYLVMLVGLLLMAVLVYSVNYAHEKEEEESSQKIVIQETEKPLLIGEGTGLSLTPPKEAVVVPTQPASPAKKEPLVVITKNVQGEKNQEIERIARLRSQALLAALSAPLLVKAGEKGQQSSTQNAALLDALANAQSSNGYQEVSSSNPTSTYDPSADRDKEAFMSRAEKDTEWMSTNTRMAGQPLEIKTGSVIPATMITGVNSDLPGSLIAQVTQSVYDTATGRNLLIPQGSKLYGVYDSRVIYGQSRVLVAWNRVIFPDGSSFTLGAMPGSDLSGYAGFEDKINNHYFRIFGSAFLMSMIMGGSAYAMDMATPNGNEQTTMQGEMISALSAQFGQTTASLLEKNLNIKPTLEIRPGYQFNVVLTKDIVFNQPYRPFKK